MKHPRFVCACATARYIARTLTQLYDGALRDTGLEAPQFALLQTLSRQQPRTQVALGRLYGLDKTTVSRNLRLLEQKGWVSSSVGADRRERRFKLTGEGRKRLAAALPRWRRAQERLRAEMSSDEWDSIFRVFATVARAAERAKPHLGTAGGDL